MILPSLNLLAFGFASPALLGWLALAAVPVLIHWLFRRRYREVTWAAMQFLHEAARKQSRRTRLEQLLLLAARVLILALIVLAFARPRWTDAGKLARESPPTLRVIVLDASLSLGRKSADASKGSTLFETGKAIAREIVHKSRAGDRFALARIAISEPRVLIRQPTVVSSAVLDEIGRLPLTFERGDVAATLRQLPEVIAARLPNERCEVIVISDFQADNWPVEQAASLLLHSKQAGRSLYELVLIDVGAALPNNAAVVGLTTDPPILAAGQPMSVTATLRNAGTSPITARRVELRIDEQLADSRRVDLPLGQDATIEFSLIAPPSGEHSLSVRLEEDSLAADNERWLSLSVRSELSVLLVNGRPAGRPRDAATFFVEQALSPTTVEKNRAAGSRWLRVATVLDSELPNMDLGQYDVAFLCDVGGLTDGDVERLRRFAQSGGGVILSLGPSVSIETLNEVAFGPQGLMSLRLTQPVTSTNADGTPSFFGFDPGDFTHPLLREFRGNPGAGLETALIRQYVRAEIEDRSRSEVALRFSSGDPAILTQSLGRGRCVLVTTSLDESWGEWAIWAAGFVPLMHELTQHAAAGRSQPREGLVGEPVGREWPSGSEAVSITLTLPDETSRTLTPRDVNGSPTLIIDETNRPGIYSLATNTTPATIERFAINVDPRESDPLQIDPKELAAARDGPDGTVVVRDADSPFPTTPEATDLDTDSLSLGLLVIVLGLLFIEQTLAWRFTAGAYVAILSVLLAIAWFVSCYF